jgi:hypothetical protein
MPKSDRLLAHRITEKFTVRKIQEWPFPGFTWLQVVIIWINFLAAERLNPDLE